MTKPDETESQRTPTPWPEPIYDNDTGPSDEGFWEWWSIPGVAKFDEEADARFAWFAVNSHERLTKERDDLRRCLEFYAKAQVTNATPGSGVSNCDDGAYARTTLQALKGTE